MMRKVLNTAINVFIYFELSNFNFMDKNEVGGCDMSNKPDLQ